MAHFGDPYGGKAAALQFSPDGQFFAVAIERGRLDLNRVEDFLYFFRSNDIRNFLQRNETGRKPAPIWVVSRSYKDGPVISQWSWLSDSSGVTFLARSASATAQLTLADLQKRTLQPLTPIEQRVKAFDIRDREHYVYTVADPNLRARDRAQRRTSTLVGTGRSLFELLFPLEQSAKLAAGIDRSQLWALVDGRRFQVHDRQTGQPLTLFDEGQRRLSLSPDGRSLLTVLPVAQIPAAWATLYPPPVASSPFRLRAGLQDLQAAVGYKLTGRYVRVDLNTGSVLPLVDAPTGWAAGWDTGPSPSPAWSSDGGAVLLPDGYLRVAPSAPSRPCIVFLELGTQSTSCVEPLWADTGSGREAGYRRISSIRFAGEDRRHVIVDFYDKNGSQGSTEYQYIAGETWTPTRSTTGTSRVANADLEITVHQGLNDSPVLLVKDTQTQVSRVILDPNPHLKYVELGEVSPYKWNDKDGRELTGGLFKPVNFSIGGRYPVVIQTHGFSEKVFEPSGLLPTAFAARALAAAGIAVLQVQDCPARDTPEEGPCSAGAYEAAVNRLAAEGLADPERVGIVGFSRTCYYVMQALTLSSLRLRAASITDGVMVDYFQYLTAVDIESNIVANQYDSLIGAQPFGRGLQAWLERSPLFNLDRAKTPLLVVALGPESLLGMWAPYAALRYLGKPVDLIVLNSDEHVLTNPTVRMASQGGTVDWFRFWLQGYEDPAAEKAEQYRRWERLCDMQVEQNPSQPAFCVRTKTH